jgi:hypothetical protein
VSLPLHNFRHISDEPDDDWDRMSMLRRMSLTFMNAFGLAPPNQKYGNAVIKVPFKKLVTLFSHFSSHIIVKVCVRVKLKINEDHKSDVDVFFFFIT